MSTLIEQTSPAAVQSPEQRMSALFPIPNEYILLSGVLVLVVLIGWEYYDTQLLLSFENKQYAPVKRAPDLDGQEEPLSFVKDESEVTSVDGNQSQTQSSNAADDDGFEQEAPVDLGSYRRFAERISVTESVANKVVPTDTREAIEALTSKIMSPMLAGCEPFGSNANYMAEKFPNLSRADICRFLVARKGNVVAASDMAEKCIAWRASVFPVKKEDLRAAISTQCFFPFGNARDGTPCVYMRGGLYDNTKATPEQFVKAAAYAIEYSLKMNPTQINVTVIVDAWIIPGAPNLGADMTFIKLFVKALSDNYPERLKRIIMYPFPWYGRAIWSVVKVFIDKRTQDKAMLIGDTGKREFPPVLHEYIDPNCVPECCAGKSKEPILDLMTTL